MKLRKQILVSAVVILATVFSGCREKGCTNPQAINYNITAEEDDGSCILCQTNEIILDTVSVYLKDTYFGSPHYNQYVAKFFLSQNVLVPSYQVCGAEKSTITLTAQSLVNQRMYAFYWINRWSGPVSLNISGSLLVDSFEVKEIGIVSSDNTPPFLPLGLDSIVVTSNNNEIIYY